MTSKFAALVNVRVNFRYEIQKNIHIIIDLLFFCMREFAVKSCKRNKKSLSYYGNEVWRIDVILN